MRSYCWNRSFPLCAPNEITAHLRIPPRCWTSSPTSSAAKLQRSVLYVCKLGCLCSEDRRGDWRRASESLLMKSTKSLIFIDPGLLGSHERVRFCMCVHLKMRELKKRANFGNRTAKMEIGWMTFLFNFSQWLYNRRELKKLKNRWGKIAFFVN